MKIKSFWKPIFIAIIIFYGSLRSGDNLNKLSLLNFNNSDKLIHFILYFILSITLQFSILRNTALNRKSQILLTFVLVVSYGIILEVFQYSFTNSRSADIFDAIANTLGCICSILVLPVINKFTVSKYL
jgi:VanZ family protein